MGSALASKQIMSVTSNAAMRLHDLMSQRNDPGTIGVRVGLRTRGCNGMSYTMDYTDKVNKFDEVIEADNGIKVVVDSKAVMFLVTRLLEHGALVNVRNMAGLEAISFSRTPQMQALI